MFWTHKAHYLMLPVIESDTISNKKLNVTTIQSF